MGKQAIEIIQIPDTSKTIKVHRYEEYGKTYYDCSAHSMYFEYVAVKFRSKHAAIADFMLNYCGALFRDPTSHGVI